MLKNLMKISVICVAILLIAGCADPRRLTVDEGRAIAARYEITAPVRWYSERGNPWQDGYVIYIDLGWVQKHGLNNHVGELMMHEQYHIKGYDRCKSRECIMYPETGIFGTVPDELCGRCKRPTTMAWIRKSY